MKQINLILTLFFFAVQFTARLSFAAEQKADPKFDTDEILCDRAPTAYLVGESRPRKGASNPCGASAKIQAIAYQCGDATNTYAQTQQFLKDNIHKARERCDQFCESVSSQCTGHIADQTSCGFTVPANRALETGKNIVHCPKHCKGQAFNYCSLYHGNFFAVDSELFKDAVANCYCQRKAL